MTHRRTAPRAAVAATATALTFTVLASAPFAPTARSGPAAVAEEARRGTPVDATTDETVRTDAGVVRGTRSGAHRIFRGIPYAGAPKGRHRWAPPRPVQPWKGVRDAKKPGPLCPQVPSAYARISSTEEDCLVLNITTPPVTTRRQAAPVLVWIHGDGSVGGGAFFDGRRLAERGLLVVTVNYRLGVFGGLALPGLGGSGTFGLQDQRAALTWVRNNARAFGGDPGNVTVAGVSFGASAVAGHLTSPASRGLFHRAVMASGEAVMDMPAGAMGPGVPGYPWYVWRTGREMEDITAEMTSSLGCRDRRPERTLACLRALPVKTILKVPHIMNAFQAFGYGNPTLPELPPTALRAGRFHRVPVLSGATRDEHRTFVGMTYDAVGRKFTEADYRRALRTAFGEARAERVRSEYPTSAFPSPALAWATVITDRMWARGTHDQHEALARHTPVYAYEFADRDAPMFLPLPGDFDFGAFHSGDIPYLFEDETAEPLFTPAQRRLSATMSGYWAAFARTGTPRGAGLPAWPSYRPGHARHPHTQSLAPRRIGPVDYYREHNLGFWHRER
ncbi:MULTISPECIES: carboxylesterase/lipase family protein [Streptomyces]|uniref:carboxylesterase/lipase family protein n=1 Tax=Streptomyces TaxID=1883 RepID=UPI001E5A62DF|nr:MULTISPECIES: carboxylesterase family protein [Streptomyces]UFQ13664.1 carboxylesterase family protein [Streptomyces huasconensis]WCL83259.1 carboxylesterase family protein [Streptomyces sp. JCM 35825]